MADDKQNKAVGAVARALRDYRPSISGGADDDVAAVLIRALERHSIDLEGASEGWLRSCLFALRDKIDARIMSI